jgi:HlyD family secretion protein
MTATVSIEVVKRENVLRVPVLALRFTPAEMETGAESVRSPGGDRAAGGSRPANLQRPAGDRPRREGGTREGGGRDGENGERRKNVNARVWVLEGGKPKPVVVSRGVQNTRYAEVEPGTVKEGDEVIVGQAGVATQSAPQGQNPLMPRMPGGGGGPGRRGGF